MKLYIKRDGGRIEDERIQVVGCPGAVASGMAAMDLIKGRTIEEAHGIKDRDILRTLVEVPEQKRNCIRLAVKTLEKALVEYERRNRLEPKEDRYAAF